MRMPVEAFGLSMPVTSRIISRWLLLALPLLAVACAHDPKPISSPGKSLITAANVDAQGKPLREETVIELAGAQNETIGFTIQLPNLPKFDDKSSLALRVRPLRQPANKAAPPIADYQAYQVLSVPVDVNRAGFVRHTGQTAAAQRLPRALLPLAQFKGSIDLARLRDPAQPRNPRAHAGASAAAPLLWIDLPIPPTARPGDYETACEVLSEGQVISSLPIHLTVYNFVLPDQRHLQMVGRLDWEAMQRLWPDLFEAVTPHLISRSDPRYAQTIAVLDQLIKLGQAHRSQVIVPRLQPLVKWPAGRPPEVTWDAFDALAGPWLKGAAFADRVPQEYWPLPATDYLDRYDARSQGEYWQAAASHFDQFDWLARAPVIIEKPTAGRAGIAESIQLSQTAAAVLGAYPRVTVCLPLEEDQLQFNADGGSGLLDGDMTKRITAAAPGLVFAPPSQELPTNVTRPNHWLRTDLPGLVPYAGAGGDERDVRLWAFLAFLRRAQMIQWNSALPSQSDADQPADPGEMVWFYPGQWFGTDAPLPSVQLKWLRRAEQDYEYLHLAAERGSRINALVMARLITKPVEINSAQNPDPAHALMCGTTDAAAWRDAQRLLARAILLRPPGHTPDMAQQIDLNVDTTHWIQPQEKPLLMGRSVDWNWSATPHDQGNWLDVRLGLDIYNIGDQRLTGALQWSAAPEGWKFDPRPIEIPGNQSINTYNVRRYRMDGAINLDRLGNDARAPVELTFTNDLDHRTSLLRMLAPIAACDKREGRLQIDGKLDDWDAADAILEDAPLVKMFNRPAVQRQVIEYASSKSSVYSGWSAQNLYVAFKLDGTSLSEQRSEKNFVDYQFRRAWGEDLCEILVQAVYAKPANSAGPLVHLVCKPHGQLIVETRQNPRLNANPWQPVVGANVRYAATNEGALWRGEVAIPWNLVNDEAHQGMRPRLIRFNFVQHQGSTGETASWAGPLDFGRDESFMGLLYTREPQDPGITAGEQTGR